MKTILLLSCVTILYSQTSNNSNLSNWQKFSKSDYKNSDYTIRKDINYFEFRKYLFDTKTDTQVTRKYIPFLSIYRKKLSSYPSDFVAKFQNIQFNNKNTGDIIEKYTPETTRYIFKIQGFLIKKDNKFWTINEKRDIVWLFDKIDTEAELYQLLKIYHINSSYGFKKTSNGYDVKDIEHKYKYDSVSKIEYNITNIYTYHIKPNGEFNKELISTKKEAIKYTSKEDIDEIACYNFPLPPVPLKVILKDKAFFNPPIIKYPYSKRKINKN